MKKLLLLLVLAVMSSTFAFAQKVTVKAGTPVSLQVVNPVKAADLEVGQKVLFRVSRDINVKGVTAIPYGTIVHGSVYEAKRSKWFGIKGRLGININEIVTSDGTVVPLTNGDIYVTGQNLLTLTKYSGQDPEVNTTSVWDAGIDYCDFYPTVATVLIGINLSFK